MRSAGLKQALEMPLAEPMDGLRADVNGRASTRCCLVCGLSNPALAGAGYREGIHGEKSAGLQEVPCIKQTVLWTG